MKTTIKLIEQMVEGASAVDALSGNVQEGFPPLKKHPLPKAKWMELPPQYKAHAVQAEMESIIKSHGLESKQYKFLSPATFLVTKGAVDRNVRWADPSKPKYGIGVGFDDPGSLIKALDKHAGRVSEENPVDSAIREMVKTLPKKFPDVLTDLWAYGSAVTTSAFNIFFKQL